MPLKYTPHLTVNAFERQVVQELARLQADGYLAQNILLPNVSHRYLPNEHDVVVLLPWGAYTLDAKEYQPGYYRVPANGPLLFRRGSPNFDIQDGDTRVLHNLPNPLHVAYQKAGILHSICKRANSSLRGYSVQSMIVVPDGATVVQDQQLLVAPGGSGGAINLPVVRLCDLVKRIEKDGLNGRPEFPLRALKQILQQLEALPTHFQAGMSTCGLRLDSQVYRVEPGSLLPMTAFLGVHELSGEPVEVRVYRKWPWSDAAERFVARTRKRLSALLRAQIPQVMRVVCAEDLPDVLIIAFCSVNGESVRGLIQRLGPLRPALARELVRNLCKTVAVLHNHAILHLDVRPEHVLLAPGFEAHFGKEHVLTGFTNPLIDDSRISTDAFTNNFDASFSAPEMRYHGHPDRGKPQNDIYSVGRLGLYCLLGERGYNSWLSEDRPAAFGIDPDLERILDRMTRYRAAARHEDAAAVIADLGFS